ncbi:hypothetical protein KSP39_PZI003666 [Platanthera zijinensis]|uniref:RBR-type E3 ubiquitin transferase n=1 Tax=Platanthera zijinensis TaxID=2320716 RepID=A0AAP0BX92_9ASPA
MGHGIFLSIRCSLHFISVNFFSKLHKLIQISILEQFNRPICWISSLLVIIPLLWRFHSSKKALMEEPLPRNPLSQAGESSGTALPAKTEMELAYSSPLPDSSCEICTEPKHTSELFAIEGCSHAYCKTCLSQYVSSKVEKNELLIKCPSPDCTTGKLDPGACSPILEHGAFDRWCAALCESMVESKFYCPFRDCSALMINDAESVMKEAECPHCNRLFCAHCMVPWHAGLSCNALGHRSYVEHDNTAARRAQMRWRRLAECCARRRFLEVTGCQSSSSSKRCGLRRLFGWLDGRRRLVGGFQQSSDLRKKKVGRRKS